MTLRLLYSVLSFTNNFVNSASANKMLISFQNTQFTNIKIKFNDISINFLGKILQIPSTFESLTKYSFE